jgi:molybdenum cofactor guanylyltransferase
VTSPLPPATGIVLAGGRSRRFGRNKLAEPLHGMPLLRHAIAALDEACSEVLVIVPPPDAGLPGTAQAGDPTHDGASGVRVVHDPEPFGGPLVGLLAGLEQAAQPLAIVTGGDMPRVSVPVLLLLLKTLDACDADAVALVLRGRRQQLPLAVRVGRATDAARRQLGVGDRRLGGILDVLLVRELADGEWRGLDPEARTLDDVDRPEDLRDLED